MFAPVVFAPHAPTSWPQDGTLVLDHFYFRLRRSDTPARSYFAWHVLCALAYVDGQRELWRLQAFTNATPASWREFFCGLPGAPGRIVCDAHSGMLKVIEERWPQTEVYLCEWHLRHALERLLAKIGGATAEQLLPRTEAAFAGRHFWARIDVEARQLDDGRMNAWLDRWSPIIASQLARRPREATDQPRSTGGLETFIKPIEAALYRRRYGMKNRERLNRLLLLLQLEANGHADERGYAKDIRDWLELTGGRPGTARRVIADPSGRPSLRDPGARQSPSPHATRDPRKRRRHSRDVGRSRAIGGQKPTREATGGGTSVESVPIQIDAPYPQPARTGLGCVRLRWVRRLVHSSASVVHPRRARGGLPESQHGTWAGTAEYRPVVRSMPLQPARYDH